MSGTNTAVEKAKLALQNRKVANMVRRVIDYARDPRFKELNKKEAYYRGTAYDDRPYDWYGHLINSGGASMMMPTSLPLDPEAIPVSFRRPNSPYHLGRIITNRFVTMLVGEHRFPTFHVPNSLNTERYLNKLAKNIGLKAHFSEAATLGGSVGSVIVMYKVIDGQYSIEKFNPKWCNVIWEDFAAGDMEAFCLCYPFEEDDWDEEEKRWVKKTFLHKRLITKEVDVQFKPQEAVVDWAAKTVKPKIDGQMPEIDEEATFEHGHTGMPAVFIQNFPRFDAPDGDASPECVYDLIDRINENLSAVNAALQGNLDPTLVLKMTAEDYKKLATMGGFVQTGSQGMGIVVGASGDAKYIEVTCENLKVAMEVIGLMRTYALEMADCVIADPHRITGAAQSASAIDKLYGPMLSKVDLMRTQYGENGLKKLLGKMLKTYHHMSGTKKTKDGLKERLFKAIKVLNPANKSTETVTPDPDIEADDIELHWGDYFLPAPADVLQATQAANIATGNKPIMTQSDAAKYIAPYLKLPSVEQTIADLATQAEEEKRFEMELAEKGAAAKAQPGPKNPGEANKNQPPRSSGDGD